MPVPFKPFAGHARLLGEGVHEPLHGAGQGGAGVGHAVAHGVAEADLHGHAGLPGELHEALGQRQDEAVDVSPGHVLEVAAGDDAPLEGLRRQPGVHVEGLLARFAELQEDVVVGHAGEHAHLVELHVPGQLEVALVGAYPGGDAGEAVAARAAHVDALAVALGVEEEFGGLDEAGAAA